MVMKATYGPIPKGRRGWSKTGPVSERVEMKTDDSAKWALIEAVIQDQFEHELQVSPRQLEADIRRLKLEIARLEGRGRLNSVDRKEGGR